MGYREDGLEHWGNYCGACGDTLGLEVHHIDGDGDNDEISNLFPVCGTCHNLLTEGTLKINPGDREVVVSLEGLYYKLEGSPKPRGEVEIQIHRFLSVENPALEFEQNYPLILLQDGVNKAFYTECHLKAVTLAELLDLEAILNPDEVEGEEDELYKFNRELVINTAVYHKMEIDAQNGRPFSDLVIEWCKRYRRDKPLKVLGGQHRAKAIIAAVENNFETERYHGIRVFFGLNKEQRSQISLISNTNIAIPKPLLDRIGEHSLGPRSREFCQKMGILKTGQDFADRQVGDDRFTVQLLRCLIVNFCRGLNFEGDVDKDLHEGVRVVSTGSETPDQYYLQIIYDKKNIWEEKNIIELGTKYAELHNAQLNSCLNAPDDKKELKRVSFKYKVFTPAVTAAWAYVSGLLSRDKARLTRHYSLPQVYDKEISKDPLNSIDLSQYRHETYDEPGYRGVGTRQNPVDLQRLVEIFLAQSQETFMGSISKELINLAVELREDKFREKEKKVAEERAAKVAERIKRKISKK
ncbi:MAG: HNH endonuclease signature motif containing protein [bacterium]